MSEKDQQTEVDRLRGMNKFLLEEVAKLASESVKREVMLAKLDAEVAALRCEE